jgi:hypothetical protein
MNESTPATARVSPPIAESRVNDWLDKAHLKLHPWAAQIPRMSEEQFELFKEDIRKNGQREVIWVKQGWLVDGLHRLGACIESDIEPRFEQYPKDDVMEFITSENLFRRHLTDDQRVAWVSKMRGPQYEKEARERMETGTADPVSKSTQGRTVDKIAKDAKTSKHKARAAEDLRKQDSKALDDVIEGKTPLREARSKITKAKPEPKGKPKKAASRGSDKSERRETLYRVTDLYIGTNRSARVVSLNYSDGKTRSVDDATSHAPKASGHIATPPKIIRGFGEKGGAK